MCKVLWASSNRMTVRVVINSHNIIVDAAPVIRKFTGQPINNLCKWMSRQGGLRIVVIKKT